MVLTNSTKVKRQVRQNADDIKNVVEKDDRIFRRISQPALAASGLGISRRAKVTQNAPAGSTITANLYNIATGVEATEGDEFGITVYCNISNGTDLNEAGTRLIEGNDITVYQSVFLIDVQTQATEIRWVCATNFDTDEDCVCS